MRPASAKETRLNSACGNQNSKEARRLLLGFQSVAEKHMKLEYYLERDCGHLVKLLCTRGGKAQGRCDGL